jgi:hypothetical protein
MDIGCMNLAVDQMVPDSSPGWGVMKMKHLPHQTIRCSLFILGWCQNDRSRFRCLVPGHIIELNLFKKFSYFLNNLDFRTWPWSFVINDITLFVNEDIGRKAFDIV